jgi:protein-S-isoprenylcysteine O-methyltransferase Ste14
MQEGEAKPLAVLPYGLRHGSASGPWFAVNATARYAPGVMRAIYTWLSPGLWLAWALYWGVSAFAAKPVLRRESIVSRLSHGVPLVLAMLLLTSPRFAGVILDTRFLPRSALLFWIGTALQLAGLLLAVAARHHLGGNWSGSVTLKQDHTLTRSGPYRFVRHPIYTGILLAVFGSCVIALGEWRGVVALALITGAFLRKIQIEERFMQGEFADAYTRYRQEVPALIPGLR